MAAFSKAFNAGDAKAISALFSEDARMITLGGRAVEGREAIEKLFAASFDENPGQTIDVKTESLPLPRRPTPRSRRGPPRLPPPGPRARPHRAEPEATRYIGRLCADATGKWLQDSIRDYPAPVPAEESTPRRDARRSCEWLVGEWIDESDEGRGPHNMPLVRTPGLPPAIVPAQDPRASRRCRARS